MTRGLIITALVLAAGFGVTGFRSYFRTATTEIMDSVRDLVPLEFEIKRLCQLTDEMLPEIEAQRKVAAEVDVDCEFLEKELTSLSAGLEEARGQMQPLREALDSSAETHRFGDRDWTRTEIERDLERRMVIYQERQAERTAKERLLATRRETLASATTRIHECQKQHVGLTQKIEVLRADLKRLELAQAAGKVSFDETKLQAARDLSTEVEKRLRTLARLVDGEAKPPVIPVMADKRPLTERFDALMSNVPTSDSK